MFTQKQVIIPDLAGRLNSAPCRLNGTFQGYSEDPNNIGLNLHVVCTQFPLPDYTDPIQKAYIEKYAHWKLACFLRDFKPRGKLDLDLLLTKPPGPNAGLTLAGIIRPRQLSAEYYKFPYRLDQLSGTLRLAKGGFELIGLTGFSGGGKAVVNGTISEPSKLAEIKLNIRTTQTPLDQKLFNNLPDRHKDLWKKFNLTGMADAQIDLYQPYGHHQPWQHRISASLSGCSGAYEGFKYPLREITGILKFDNDRLEIQNLRGRNRQAEVNINGTALHLDQPKPSLDLKISAQNISLDDDLARLLPRPPAQVLRDCRLTGVTDLTGFLKTAPDRPFDFQFLCDLKKAEMCYKDFPYPIRNLAGTLEVRPEEVVINAFNASRGLQTINGSGKINFSKTQNRIALKINADHLNVDSQLYAALTPAQKEAWNLVRPSGTINVQTELNKTANRPWDWKLNLTLLKSGLQYKSMPPITDLNGQVLLTPKQAHLKNIVGKINHQSLIETDGIITADRSTQILFNKLNIDSMPITDSLLTLFGDARLLKNLNWTPGGSLSTRLNHVRVTLGPDKTQAWDLDGTLSFTDSHMEAFDKIPCSLEFTGKLSMNTADGDFSAAGQFLLQSFNYNDRRIANLTANLNKPPANPTLTIDQIKGNYAGGQISGLCKMEFQPKQTSYGLQLILDNVDAATALKLGTRNNSIRGKMRGEIYMLGTLGQKYIRLGGGSLEITGAEALKVPLMAHIYEKASREPPNLASFHNITLDFTVEQHQVTLQELRLAGPTLNLVGSGTINISSDRIALNLITAAPKGVPVLQDIVQGAAKEFTEMEVHGSLDNPAISVRPMKDISETLKTFLEGRPVK